MRISDPWLDRPETAAVLTALAEAGHQALFVGGCVRDALAGLPVSDIDIATDAPPARVAEVAGTAGLEAIPTGEAHGTMTVVSSGMPHEVTTFRRDVETDGRRAVVAFSDRIEDDAARRDFTINALYARADGTVLDPLGTGAEDLAAGRLRFVGSPECRIREDYLRILRYFRFLARFGSDGPDAEALAAIAQTLDGLDTLPAERVGHEVLRLLASPDPARAIATMAAAGVLIRVLPGADPTGLGPLIHVEAEAGSVPDPLRRLAVLGGDPAARLRLSNAQAKAYGILRDGLASDTGVAALAYRHGAGAAFDIALLRAALAGTPLAVKAAGDARRGAEARFPVQASDLMPAYEGAALGARLKQLEDAWIASDFALSREALLRQ